MAPRPSLERLTFRPLASDWRNDELISLAEASALFFPDGPMTSNALRIAYHRGELAAVQICGKLFTTPRDLVDLVATRRRPSESPVAAAGFGAPPPMVPAQSPSGAPIFNRRVAPRRRRGA